MARLRFPLPSLRALERLTLRQLEWAAIAIPLAFFGLYYYLMLGPLRTSIHAWYGVLALWVLLPLAVAGFARLVFRAVRSIQAANSSLRATSALANERLVALLTLELALARESEASELRQLVLDLAANLTRAGAAALVFFDQDGVPGVCWPEKSASARCELAPVIVEAAATSVWPRAPDRHIEADDLVRLGLPSGPSPSPPTHLLCLPLVHHRTVLGGLVVADKEGGGSFDPEDRQILAALASHAAVAAESERLHRDVTAMAFERERERISHELHDGLAQVLGFVNAKAQAVEEYLRNGDLEGGRRQTVELAEAARSTYSNVREGIIALRADYRAAGSLRALLDEYLAEYRELARLSVETIWQVDPDDLRLSPATEIQLLRIVQEALTNARRHANAANVRVTFSGSGASLTVQVEDDGRGFDRSRLARREWPQFGLRMMEERARSVDAELSIESALGVGTAVKVTVPASSGAD